MAASGFAKEHLRSFIERIERLEEEKAALVSDIKEVYGEAKSSGFDTKIMRQVVRLRKLDAADREQQQELLETYLRALGTGAGVSLDVEVRAERFIAANTQAEASA